MPDPTPTASGPACPESWRQSVRIALEADPLTRDLKAGQTVRFRKRGATLYEYGIVQFVWMCLDTPAVDIVTNDGGRVSMIPEFGDEVIR